ncbi:hypothetical protein F5Y10DRAFT_249346 [Nemania abortiva]|nr:hypothetical protein F5Y10DRAFT_249346 [Nemania abortiva]
MIEFENIVENAVGPFKDILLGSAPAKPSPVILGIPGGAQTVDIAANYSTACSNATTLFDSPLKFGNCMMLGVTNVLLEQGVITLDENSVQSTDSSLHFGDILAFNGSGVLDDIATCILSTCQNTSDSSCDWTVNGNLTEAYDPQYNITEKLQKMYLGFSNYCNGAGVQPNSDVVGPGVLISYLSQSAVVAAFFFASKAHHATRRFSTWRRRWNQNALAHDPQNTPPSAPRRALAHCFAAIQAVMADFQEAQAVFVSTVQIATLWFYRQTKLTQNSRSYAEANATIELAQVIPLLGLLPVLLGQTILQRGGKHWWYTTALTSVTAALTWWCISRPDEADYATLWVKLKETSPAPQCGGNPSPMTYCGVYNTNKIYNEASFHYSTASKVGDGVSAVATSSLLVNIFTVVVLVCPPFLLVDQIYTWIRGLRIWTRTLQALDGMSRWSKLRDSTKGFVSKIIRFILFLVWFILQLALFVSLVYTFCFLLFIFGFQTQLAGGWSYGQLVAALIWVPIGLRLVYYIIFGIEKGVESRLGDKFDVRGKGNKELLASDSPSREVHFMGKTHYYILSEGGESRNQFLTSFRVVRLQ